MSVTDTDLLKEMQYHLLENGNANADGATLITTMYSITEMVDALNRRQYKFLRDTGMIVTRTTIAGVGNQSQYALPSDDIMDRRVAWNSGTTTTVLTRSDTWEQDSSMPGWDTNTVATPISYFENSLPNLTLGVAPVPQAVGTLNLLYVQLSATLTGGGVNLVVPDDFTPYVMWGAMEDLLSSDGEAFDPARAAYCAQRYEEGVELVRLILGG